jgi:hypothetical protein
MIQEFITGRSETLQLHDPTGLTETTQVYAPRLDTLEGKTICELSINGWQSHRALPLVRKLLQERYPTAKFIPFTEFPIGSKDSGIDSDETADLVLQKGGQAAIIGNAA